MRTRLLATTAALLALATGCADESVPASDPGHPTPAPSPSGSAPTGAPPGPAAIGEAFRAFARGGEPPPMADEVELYLGNAFTGVVAERDAADPVAWATCTETGSYAALTCPLSPLTVLRRHDAVEYTAKPRGLCMPTYGPLPPDLRALARSVVVPTPASIDTCAQNFAVQLFTDEDGRLVAVSTLLGEP